MNCHTNVFDTDIQKSSKEKKNATLLSFKVGIGKVIRRWDEALLTMSKREKAQLEMEWEWAYGTKGQPDVKIPPKQNHFWSGIMAIDWNSNASDIKKSATVKHGLDETYVTN